MMTRTTVITAGESKRMMFVPETSYGITPGSGTVATLSFGTEYYSTKDESNFDVIPHWIGSNRSYSVVTRNPVKAGFVVHGVAREDSESPAYTWQDWFAVYSMGGEYDSPQVLAEHLPSFSALFDIQEIISGTTHDYFLFNGCKIDKLVIGATDPGKIITFDATVLARYIALSSSKTFTGLQSVTVGADPSDITTNVITYSGLTQYDIGGGLTAWQPRKWQLTIDNHLKAMPGNILGDDSNYYQVADTIEEDRRDITLEATLPMRDQTIETAKRVGTPVAEVTIPIGANSVIHLTNGAFMADDFPEYKQELNEEKVKIIFMNMTIVHS